MWPFKKKPSRPLPFAEPLSTAERAWLQQQRENFAAFTGGSVPEATGDPVSLHACDDLLRKWHVTPEAERPDANALVLAIGVVLGDASAKRLGMEWKIITDPFGTDVGLWWAVGGETAGEGSVTLSPTHSVAKYFLESPEGFVAAFYEQVAAQAAGLQRQYSAQAGR